ncbi:MAG: hypothetical protein KKA73_28510 [Chloroflexi bacterium]|nr:hypothetical protein [Chloroflexota bacterium]
MKRRLVGQPGQAVVWGLFVILIVTLLAAALLDVGRAESTRAELYHVAEDAAFVGAGRGRDYATYLATGTWTLDSVVAHDEALAQATARLDELQVQGRIQGYTFQVAVLSETMGGTVPGFPPVPRAGLAGITDWTESEPAVGVYIAADVPAILFGLVNGADYVTVHVFSAAGLAEAQQP